MVHVNFSVLSSATIAAILATASVHANPISGTALALRSAKPLSDAAFIKIPDDPTPIKACGGEEILKRDTNGTVPPSQAAFIRCMQQKNPNWPDEDTDDPTAIKACGGEEILKRDTNGTVPPSKAAFIKCMQRKNPNWPDENPDDPMAFKACGGEGLHKRDVDTDSIAPPNELALRAIPPTKLAESAFMKCMRKKHPKFPKVKVTNSADILACTGQGQTRRAVDVDLASRGLFGTLTNVLGKVLQYDSKCDKNDKNQFPIPKYFQEAGPFRGDAKEWCDKMKKDVLKHGATTVRETIPDAVTKNASWLRHNQKAILTMALAITPQGRAILKAAKEADKAYDKWCHLAIQTFGTKDKGCTAELGYFKKKFLFFPINGATTTAITDGYMEIEEKANLKLREYSTASTADHPQGCTAPPKVKTRVSNATLISRMETFVTKQMQHYDPSHNPAHVARVVRLAHRLLAAERARGSRITYNETIITLAALLHDIGDRKYLVPGSTQDPATMVRDALLNSGCDPTLAERAQTVVSNVAYSKEVKNPNIVARLIAEDGFPELAIVQDADRLDAIGAVGIGRCFTYLGAKGPQLAADGLLRWELDDAVGIFRTKLVNLELMMKTDSGRDMARKRSLKLREFIRWWEEEKDEIKDQGA
ncbi:conserved hypothetical protein [Uncinocarpus reesii 1704]|uniref:HD/PDEase domain-containing protein n=1 Tax=Uncinocarpus reesii (strain UAMH 1704) TaxID=336963 RepID=C4JW01_UNCRE|nr:uncharacterized protein UREG_06743 [Uncinocarpus reesii 1704]EEP81878.1 conserved hypothetical protein [Uncinocarpus reesii 1704]